VNFQSDLRLLDPDFSGAGEYLNLHRTLFFEDLEDVMDDEFVPNLSTDSEEDYMDSGEDYMDSGEDYMDLDSSSGGICSQ